MKWIFVTTPLRARGGYWGRCTSPITDPDSGHGVSSSEDSADSVKPGRHHPITMIAPRFIISNRDHQLRFAKMEPSQGGPGLEAPSPASPASQGKRKIEFKLTPGKKIKSKDEPRMITLGQYKERHKKGCYMTVDLSGTDFPIYKASEWVKKNGLKLSDSDKYFEFAWNPGQNLHLGKTITETHFYAICQALIAHCTGVHSQTPVVAYGSHTCARARLQISLSASTRRTGRGTTSTPPCTSMQHAANLASPYAVSPHFLTSSSPSQVIWFYSRPWTGQQTGMSMSCRLKMRTMHMRWLRKLLRSSRASACNLIPSWPHAEHKVSMLCVVLTMMACLDV